MKRFLTENFELLISSGVALIFRIIGAGSSFVLGVVLARKLGATESGYFFIVFNFLVFLSATIRCGFDDVLLRLVSVKFSEGAWFDVKSFSYFSLVFVCGAACLGSFIIFLFSGFISNFLYSKPELEATFRVMVWGVIGLSGLTISAVVLQACGRTISSVFTLNIFSNFIVALVVYFFVDNVCQASLVYSVSTFLALLCGVIFIAFTLPPGKGAFSRVGFGKAAERILPPAMVLWPVLILSQFLLLVGQFFAGVYATEEEAAFYAAAQRSAMLVSFALMAVNLIVAPKFASLYGAGAYEAISKLARSSVLIVFAVALPISMFMLLFPEFVMGLFGGEFVSGSNVLRILVLGQLVNVIFGPIFYILLMSGGEKEGRRVVFLVFPLSLVVGYFLTKNFGVNGAAFSSGIVFFVQGVLTVVAVNRRYGFKLIGITAHRQVFK